MMLGFDPSSQNADPNAVPNPFAGFPGLGGPSPGMEGAEDPMMKMMQQMMGSMGSEGGMPTFPGMPGQPQPQETGDPYAYLWRLIHAIFALSLGLYIALSTPFSGSKLLRETPSYTSFGSEEFIATPTHFFWIFATVEVLLQSSRFFLEKGRVQPGGVMGLVMGFLPEPYKGYLQTLGRYSRIWGTVSGDAFVCVFVLGVCAWWRGA
jgi:hypothetical protein